MEDQPAGGVASFDPALLQARFEIERRLFDYAYTYDTGDAEGWAALFTPDGIWEAVLLGHEDSPTVRLEGHEQLRDFVQRANVRVLHHQGSVVFDRLDASSAETRSMVIVTMQVPEIHPPQLLRHGIYVDTWAKTKAGWRIARRRFVSYQNPAGGGPARAQS